MNISINTKILAIAGGSIALIAAIGGGTVAYNNYKAAEAKKAAELAYAQRPIIDASCIMNGYGKGHCNFTNTGKTTGAQCGNIHVDGPGAVYSDKFCSGMVQPMTTEKVEFNIPAVDKLCDNGFNSWTDKCNFDFIEDDVPAVTPAK
jgi:hypothetical protein